MKRSKHIFKKPENLKEISNIFTQNFHTRLLTNSIFNSKNIILYISFISFIIQIKSNEKIYLYNINILNEKQNKFIEFFYTMKSYIILKNIV